MADRITQEDLVLVLSQSASPRIDLKIEVLDQNQKIMETIHGVVNGSMSISGESEVRRTASLTVQPTITEKLKLTEDSLLWLN